MGRFWGEKVGCKGAQAVGAREYGGGLGRDWSATGIRISYLHRVCIYYLSSAYITSGSVYQAPSGGTTSQTNSVIR
ncbi:MAG: hypothetical protein NZ602_04920 [Thermoguttaceae bacterium]|nr:hypothetical protein [Thermoguttaceae bacterium]MDW8038046.1 hypothetical protein [Thermoguttaceae bacterium]